MSFRELLEKYVKPVVGDGVTFKYKGYEWEGKIVEWTGEGFVIDDISPKSDWKRISNKPRVTVTEFQIKSVNGKSF